VDQWRCYKVKKLIKGHPIGLKEMEVLAEGRNAKSTQYSVKTETATLMLKVASNFQLFHNCIQALELADECRYKSGSNKGKVNYIKLGELLGNKSNDMARNYHVACLQFRPETLKHFEDLVLQFGPDFQVPTAAFLPSENKYWEMLEYPMQIMVLDSVASKLTTGASKAIIFHCNNY
jgi:hypothetical protein